MTIMHDGHLPSGYEGQMDILQHHVKEERPIQTVRKIVVRGSVDVVFQRSDKPMLTVAGETPEAVASVKTRFNGGKLVVEREGMTISMADGHNVVIQGSTSGVVVIGNIAIGEPIGVNIRQGKAVVFVALPEAPSIKIQGSGDVTMRDLRQAGLELEIEGSGNINAYGQVADLEVDIAGSGDVDASELIADRARLAVAGSGSIEALIRTEVRARVVGSGDILVRGNPPHRDHSVAGSGEIKFG